MLEVKYAVLKKAKILIDESMDTLRRAVAAAHANSTSGESKQEGKYDTRGVEASYLAEGQAEQLSIMEENFAKFQKLEFEDEPDNVLVGSLVVVTADDDEMNYLILPAGAGMTIEHEGESFLVITPISPLGEQLVGVDLGAKVVLPEQTNAYVSEIY